MNDKHEEVARQIILNNRYLTLSTCSGNIPWISPLAYVVDDNFDFYFYSAIDSIHIRNLHSNPRAACAIFNSTESSDDVDGLQFSASVSEVDNSLLAGVMDLYFTKSFPDINDRKRWLRPITDFSGDALQRFYRLNIIELFKIDPSSPKIDRRVQIPVEKL